MKEKVKYYRKRIYGIIKQFIKQLSCFEFTVAICQALAELYHKNNKLGKFITNINDAVIMKYIYINTINTHTFFENSKNTMVSSNISRDSNIWMCWWQGEENEPELVQMCINSVKHNSGNHSVIVITESNYCDYVKIPSKLIDCYSEGKICTANFIDVVRVMLLAQYGGIWIDSTVFMIDRLPEHVYDYTFVSHKREAKRLFLLYPSHNRWGSYFMATGENSLLFEYAKSVFLEWFSKHDTVIQYGMIDYIFQLGYEKVDEIKRIIDAAPYINENMNDLCPILNKEFDRNNFESLISDTNMFKLTYKMNLDKVRGNKETYYGYIWNMVMLWGSK